MGCLAGLGRGITEVGFSYHLFGVLNFPVALGIICTSGLSSGILLAIVLILDICFWFSLGKSEARWLLLCHFDSATYFFFFFSILKIFCWLVAVEKSVGLCCFKCGLLFPFTSFIVFSLSAASIVVFLCVEFFLFIPCKSY